MVYEFAVKSIRIIEIDEILDKMKKKNEYITHSKEKLTRKDQ